MGEARAAYRRLFPILLPPSPTWSATRAAVASLPSLPTAAVAATAAPSCRLPTMDPWHPDILPYVSERPEVRCAARQVSLVYITLDTIHINATALQQLGLRRDQVIP